MFSCKSKSMNSAFIFEAEVLTSSANAFKSKLYDVKKKNGITSLVSENVLAMLTKYLTGSCPEIEH